MLAHLSSYTVYSLGLDFIFLQHVFFFSFNCTLFFSGFHHCFFFNIFLFYLVCFFFLAISVSIFLIILKFSSLVIQKFFSSLSASLCIVELNQISKGHQSCLNIYYTIYLQKDMHAKNSSPCPLFTLSLNLTLFNNFCPSPFNYF